MKRMMLRAAVLAVSFIAVTGTSAAEPAPTTRPAIEFKADIVYGKAGGEDLLIDLARPTNAGRDLPCVVFVHGGGWSAGNRHAYDAAIKVMAMRGYVGATVEYRLAPKFVFPAQVEDVKCAVRYMRSHAVEYGIDPGRIGAFGDSAGGHLVMMLGVTQPKDSLEGDGGWSETSSAVQAVVSYFGPTDLSAADIPEISKPIVKTFIGASADEKPALWRQASPINYVRKGEPPMLLLQGTIDPLVPLSQAVEMSKAMSKVDAPGRIEILVGAGHGFIGADRQHALDATHRFFDETLREAPRKAK